MERTIKVTGTGKIAVKPDLTIINLDFSDVLPTYEAALKASANDVGVIKDALAKAIEGTDVKINETINGRIRVE